MANPLRIKVATSAISIVIMIIFPLLDNKFFAEVTIKKWSKLTWDDFRGIPRPFSVYGAAIHSSVYLDYDSIKKQYFAYAGQNNIRSWLGRINSPGLDYALNHEQYHFNITEFYSRKLNEYIAENPDGDLHLFQLRLNSILYDLRQMQRKYDKETGHSIIMDKQRRWEYQIDSLLQPHNGWISDRISGGRIFLPQVPDTIKGVGAGAGSYTGYEVLKYGMRFRMISYPSERGSGTVENARIYEERRGRIVKSISIDTTMRFESKVFSISCDTMGYTYYSQWIHARPYLYELLVGFPNTTGDTTGYSLNAMSFLNSFNKNGY